MWGQRYRSTKCYRTTPWRESRPTWEACSFTKNQQSPAREVESQVSAVKLAGEDGQNVWILPSLLFSGR